MTEKINGVSIGDKFKHGLNGLLIAEVVDILEKKSLAHGKNCGHICIAKSNGLSSNEFEVPFATVVRGRI